MSSGTCTINGQKGRDNAYTTTGGFYCGVITTSSTKYYNYCLKFTTPTFTGTSSSVKFTISAMDNQPENSTVVLRYALCSSDANFSKYQTSGTPSDSYQIKTGTASFAVSSSYKDCSFTVSTTALKSNTTYYLIIYSRAGYTSQNSIHIRASTYHSATLNYTANYTLTTSATGSTITVTRSGTALSSGATITEGDVLTISASASTGYNTPTLKVNGSAFTSGGTHTVASNVSVTSTATKITYTISYNANGGTGAPSSQTKTYGVSLTLSSTKPTKADSSSAQDSTITISYNANNGSSTPGSGTGTKTVTTTTTYTFKEWNTASGGTGTSYAAGASYTANAAATLYAQYTSSSSSSTSNPSIKTAAAISRPSENIAGYTVSFNANGGSTTPDAITSTKTRKYTFSKWKNLNSGTEFSASTSYTFSVSATLTAQWTSSDTNNAITLPVLTRAGYTFKGWSTSSSATSGSTGSYIPTEDIVLYAIWEPLGLVYIFDGENWNSYQIYIYSGTEWVQYIPYIYDGANWSMCS